jgi:hypothetical protein
VRTRRWYVSARYCVVYLLPSLLCPLSCGIMGTIDLAFIQDYLTHLPRFLLSKETDFLIVLGTYHCIPSLMPPFLFQGWNALLYPPSLPHLSYLSRPPSPQPPIVIPSLCSSFSDFSSADPSWVSPASLSLCSSHSLRARDLWKPRHLFLFLPILRTQSMRQLGTFFFFFQMLKKIAVRDTEHKTYHCNHFLKCTFQWY